MKRIKLSDLRVPALVAALAMVCTQTVGAEGASTEEINAAILLEGSLPVTWDNDTDWPWTVEGDWVKSGNAGNADTSSSLAFTYNSEYQTEVLFDWWNNQSSSSYHWVKYYVDGTYKGSASSYATQVRFYLPKGSHVVEIVDSIGNSKSTNYYAGLKNVSVKEAAGLEDVLLTKGSRTVKFTNDATYPWMPEEGYVRSTNYNVSKSSSKLSAAVSIERTSRLSFERRVGTNDSRHWCRFYINGESYNSTYSDTNWVYVSVVLQPGEYTLEWEDSNTSAIDSFWSQIRNVEVSDEWVEVDVAPGTLGVEVLYKVDVLKDVQLLKVNGAMNSDDWATLKQMTDLRAVDLSGAKIDAIPSNAFKGLSRLSTVTLPEGLVTIGSSAFTDTQIYYLTIPSTVKTIGTEAFYETRLRTIDFAEGSQLETIGYQAFSGCSSLREFIMPNSVTSLATRYNYSGYESYTFYGCSSLTKISLSDGLTVLPPYTLRGASSLTEVKLPKDLAVIGTCCFQNNKSLAKIRFPESLTTIGENAFEACALDTVVLPLKLTSLGQYAFYNNKSLKRVELPSNISGYDYNFYGCTGLETVVCPSATPPSIKNDPFYGRSKSAMSLVVPSFAVVNYKLDPYWYEFGNITEGDDIDYWKISGELSLVNNRRMEGKPDIDLTYGGRLIVGGNAPMTVGKLNIYESESNPSRLLNTCGAFTCDSIDTHFWASADTWYFITPMADVNIRDIKVSGTESYVFRYYDGADRAATGTGTSWKNVTDTKLTAGRGYIFQCNASSLVTFPVATALHSQVLGTEAVSLPLTAHASDNAANKGWNYVGNPYPCYYDIRYMDFSAPLTVWTGSTYRAYSIADDDYVLRPMQGFFVQKPDAVDAIVMQTGGKQVASTVNRASNAPARSVGQSARALFNIGIGADSICDVTRVVLNEKASVDYETECDATKFMSMDASVPQIYTIDGAGNRLSINERPEGTGTVRLGVYAGDAAKPLVISAQRNDGDICLHDAVANVTVNLGESGYTFVPEATGNIDDRFTLSVKAPESAAVDTLGADASVTVVGGNGVIEITADRETEVTVYAIDGSVREKLTANGKTAVAVGTGMYIIKAGNRTCKVAVK